MRTRSATWCMENLTCIALFDHGAAARFTLPAGVFTTCLRFRESQHLWSTVLLIVFMRKRRADVSSATHYFARRFLADICKLRRIGLLKVAIVCQGALMHVWLYKSCLN